jgi:hypothetical protein
VMSPDMNPLKHVWDLLTEKLTNAIQKQLHPTPKSSCVQNVVVLK